MSIKCGLGLHRWVGCKCTACGKTRDEGHDWSRDCEKCARCGAASAHKWAGCKCTACGKTRDESHTWKGCTCKICGKTRDEEHPWAGCTCAACGKKRDQDHDWSQDCERCRQCGKTRRNQHTFEGSQCARCGTTSPDAAFEKGCKLLRSQSPHSASEAEKWFEVAAQQGHTKAKNMLGIAIVQARSDYRTAYRWICEAAAEGNPEAKSNRQWLERALEGRAGMVRLDYSW